MDAPPHRLEELGVGLYAPVVLVSGLVALVVAPAGLFVTVLGDRLRRLPGHDP